MKHINPLMILAILLSFWIFFATLKSKEINTRDTLNKKIKVDENIAKEIVSYKKMWENPKFYKKNIKRLLRNLRSKKINYDKREKSNTLQLSFSKVTPFDAKYILSLILNQNFKIANLNIERADNSHLDIVVKVEK